MVLVVLESVEGGKSSGGSGGVVPNPPLPESPKIILLANGCLDGLLTVFKNINCHLMFMVIPAFGAKFNLIKPSSAKFNLIKPSSTQLSSFAHMFQSSSGPEPHESSNAAPPPSTPPLACADHREDPRRGRGKSKRRGCALGLIKLPTQTGAQKPVAAKQQKTT